MENPLLSICIICYNQSTYIIQAIESVLSQQTDFTKEIIIADDYSTDGTREIVIDYRKKFPDLIKILPRASNVGPAKNFTELFYAANGKYIAYLEGDDYWTDNNKLQKQIDFLEANPDFSVCFTDSLEIFSEDPNDTRNYLRGGSYTKSETTINDLIFRNYIQTCTVVFKNKLFEKFPKWYTELKMGDWPLHLLNAQYGKIKYLNFHSAIHRNHSSGVWSTQNILGKIYLTLQAYDVLEANTELYKLSNFKRSKSNLLLSSVKYHFKQHEFLNGVINFYKGIYLYPRHLCDRTKPI